MFFGVLALDLLARFHHPNEIPPNVLLMTLVIIIPVGDIILSAVHRTLFLSSSLFLFPGPARPGNRKLDPA
jgi:hypothetical protein